jgi:hypothetical protein
LKEYYCTLTCDLLKLNLDKRNRTMAISKENIILNVDSGVSCGNLPEKQPGRVSKETDDAYSIPGELVLEERSSVESLSIYLKSLGYYRKKKRCRHLSRELHRMLDRELS